MNKSKTSFYSSSNHHLKTRIPTTSWSILCNHLKLTTNSVLKMLIILNHSRDTWIWMWRPKRTFMIDTWKMIITICNRLKYIKWKNQTKQYTTQSKMWWKIITHQTQISSNMISLQLNQLKIMIRSYAKIKLLLWAGL